jgi:peptidoglycan/xylan/chitin deacetylase (PgdA/CDA1 family)
MKKMIRDIIGKTPRYMRFPYGSFNADVLRVMAREDLRNFHYSFDSRDFESRNRQAILNALDTYMSTTANPQRTGEIGLFHNIHAQTIAAIGEVIDRVRAKGYRFVLPHECAGDTIGSYNSY